MKDYFKFLGAIFIAAIFICFLTIKFCSAENLTIKMLNVGQGDSILIQSPTENILVDTSDADERDKLLNELHKAGIKKIDKLILTHPHADHIGNTTYMLKLGAVNQIFDNGIISASKFYTSYLDACKKFSVNHNSLKQGDKIFIGDAYIEVFAPSVQKINLINNGKKSDPNNDSIVFKLVNENFSMLFTGDAEIPTENLLIQNSFNLKADILKAGHHGAASANSLPFVKAVSPKFVLISAGVPTTKRGGNTYGHPRQEAINNFLAANVPKSNIFCTATNGTITILSDGKNFSVTPEF